ncbi:MAG: cysteine hydrolase [Dehalococcoidia bacterium]|nr:cysteine hydrolase [Dehalococcoidia bacterium]MSQ16341.1 cysteine hydrolase [Dehalococcoidia bacterium]
MPNVVLVVDMVRGFLEPGHNLYCGDAARLIIPPVRRLLQRETSAGGKVLFISDHHDPDDLEFQIFPVHCVKGTEEPQVIPDLASFIAGSNVIPKNRYSGFFNTDLAQRLDRLRPDKLIICGVCTDICVLHTTADARNRDYTVEVPADCVASFDPQAHQWALAHLQNILGATVV